MKILKRYTQETLFEGEFPSMRKMMESAINNSADLRSADLRYTDLSSANLRSADLRYTDLSSANLRSADLRYTDLSSANLRYANLRSADLRYTDLSSANLRSADLRSANLRSANLRYANLRSANLRYAVSPPLILLASWGEVSDELCIELMRYDAANHPNPKLFDAWANGGSCPYDGNISRAAQFQEKRALWSPGPPKSALELMIMLFKEKGVKWEP